MIHDNMGRMKQDVWSASDTGLLLVLLKFEHPYKNSFFSEDFLDPSTASSNASRAWSVSSVFLRALLYAYPAPRTYTDALVNPDEKIHE